ncbi:MAG TPA: long-chain-fatty-acid--CoA ligase [Burkholderiaceae bacterium]|jgi:long-chain acyl-CoA synthetase|nr:long-chain-fatty-acid--CoA ligase [Burkholderiaceae bacterium]
MLQATRTEQLDRFWLKSYPAGVETTIDERRIGTLVQMLQESFARNGPQVAFACMGADLTYRQVDRLSSAVASWLQSRGLDRGDRVAIMLPNVMQYPVVMAGILRAGCVVVNVNPLYMPRELEHQLADSGARAIFVLENFAATVAAVRAHVPTDSVCVCRLGDLLGPVRGALVNFVVRRVRKLVPAYSLPDAVAFGDVLRQGARTPPRPVPIEPGDVACLQYTGGTTGVAKGATLLHRNLYANVLQVEAWFRPALDLLPPGEQYTTVAALPLYHIFALTGCALMSVRRGGKCVLIPNPRDIAALVREVARHRVHCLPAVNTLFNALAGNEAFRALDFSSMRICLGGGMAVQSAVAKRWAELTGRTICQAYGLSETSPGATVNPVLSEEFNGSIGLPLPSTDIAILDDAGNRLPTGTAGEIAIRGPQLMDGYWLRPDETARVMTDDGFFRSGDIGVMDERGYVRIVDRKKDMILVSGFKVFPNEIEDVVASHPGVRECAAIGVPDERAGEAVKLFVVRADPALTEHDLVEYCHENLTGYKRPKFIEFRSDLPKSNVGKILRRALRDEAAAAH